jgi:hypothetical protein
MSINMQACFNTTQPPPHSVHPSIGWSVQRPIVEEQLFSPLDASDGNKFNTKSETFYHFNFFYLYFNVRTSAAVISKPNCKTLSMFDDEGCNT